MKVRSVECTLYSPGRSTILSEGFRSLIASSLTPLSSSSSSLLLLFLLWSALVGFVHLQRNKIKLEIWGRAQSETARRRCPTPSPTGKIIQGGWNSARSNVTCSERSCISLHSTRSVDLEWVNMRAYNFFVSRLKFTRFFRLTWEGCSWSPAFTIFNISCRSGYVRDQTLRLSEIAPNFRCFWHPRF